MASLQDARERVGNQPHKRAAAAATTGTSQRQCHRLIEIINKVENIALGSRLLASLARLR
jgi:hypothetical protein